MDFKADLIRRAKAHCRMRGIALATLGSRVANDGKFFDRIENRGGGFTVETYRRFLEHFEKHEAA